MQLNFKIDQFEGPLDLLLTLIAKHKMNILDIEIVTIINQYLEIIKDAQQQNLDIASDFIDMAARLIYLKSVYLLPKDDEGEKLKAELQGQLIEYSQAKRAAEMFRQSFVGDRIFTRPAQEIKIDSTYDIQHSVDELVKAYSRLTDRSLARTAPKQETFEPIVSTPVVSVSSKIYSLLKGIIKKNINNIQSAFVGMKSKSEAVATFLAILELMRGHRLKLSDSGEFELRRKEKR